MQDESADKSQGNRDTPHYDNIADQPEAGVAAGAEDTGDSQRVHCLSDHIVGADKQHKVQIVLRQGRQVEDVDHGFSEKDNDQSSQYADSERATAEAGGVLSRLVHALFPQRFPEKHRAGAAYTEADDTDQVSDRGSDGGRRHHIGVHMPQNDGVGGEGKSPDTVV